MPQASFERAVKLDPKSVDARLALAIYHLNFGSAKDAKEAVQGALSKSHRATAAPIAQWRGPAD